MLRMLSFLFPIVYTATMDSRAAIWYLEISQRAQTRTAALLRNDAQDDRYTGYSTVLAYLFA